jgi:hypothetical protein
MEAGTIGVRPDLLKNMAATYGEPLDRMVTAFAAIMLFEDDLPPYLLAKSRRPPYTVAKGKAFFASNIVEVWSLDDIAEWERGLADRFSDRSDLSLWIVSPNFIDLENPEFLSIVVEHLLIRGVNITYFVAERDLHIGEKFYAFLERVTRRLRRLCDGKIPTPRAGCENPKAWGEISAFGLTRADLAWFTASIVIANPEDIQSGAPNREGFTIPSVEGEHRFGIPLNDRDLRAIVDRIKFEIESRLEAGNQSPGSWKPKALREHAPFKREFPNA